jgi:hypothetical protein
VKSGSATRGDGPFASWTTMGREMSRFVCVSVSVSRGVGCTLSGAHQSRTTPPACLCSQVTVELPRFLDASLIQVDSHPTYITIVIKGKVLRLRFPEEVNSDAGTAKRSATTGDLVITLPRVAKRVLGVPSTPRAAGLGGAGSGGGGGGSSSAAAGAGGGAPVGGAGDTTGRVRRLQAPKKLGDALLEEASRAVSVAGIVGPGEAHLKPVSTKLLREGGDVGSQGKGGDRVDGAAAPATSVPPARAGAPLGDLDDSEVPPLE